MERIIWNAKWKSTKFRVAGMTLMKFTMAEIGICVCVRPHSDGIANVTVAHVCACVRVCTAGVWVQVVTAAGVCEKPSYNPANSHKVLAEKLNVSHSSVGKVEGA